VSYNFTTDFLALLRTTPGGQRSEQMPGLDYVVAALARAGLINLVVSQSAPTANQATTVWFQPAVPSWSAEGVLFLWNAAAVAFQPATPVLWAAYLSLLATVNTTIATKLPVRAGTTGANIVLSGLQTIDGVVLAAGDRILVKDQADQTTNGIYSVAVGPWGRASDASSNSQWVQGSMVLVTQGNTNPYTLWIMTAANPIVLGTTFLTWRFKV
jgi:hypothetical protein